MQEFGYMEKNVDVLIRRAKRIDKKQLAKVLVELAEEDLKCPENRRYVSMSGLIKVKSKVQTQWENH